MSVIRNPAAAGRFYPRFKSELKKLIKDCFEDKIFGPGKDFSSKHDKDRERNVLGAVSPHAGYVYSGPATASSMQAVLGEKIPDTIILFGTTHTGYRSVGLMKQGFWETPLGKIAVDEDVAAEIIKNSSIIIEDDSAFNGFPHGREHCIEVQVPFIQYISQMVEKEIKIIPIKVGTMELSRLKQIGDDIAKSISIMNEKGIDVAIIASSDMTHYQPANPYKARKEIESKQHSRDEKVINSFKDFDIENTLKNALNTTVCGPQTISSLMCVGKSLGYQSAEFLKYYTSFEKGGKQEPCDYSVGYFSGIIKK